MTTGCYDLKAPFTQLLILLLKTSATDRIGFSAYLCRLTVWPSAIHLPPSLLDLPSPPSSVTLYLLSQKWGSLIVEQIFSPANC